MDHDATIDRMFHLLVTGDGCGAMLVAEDAMRAGASLDEIVRHVFLPVATLVERLHRAAQITAEAYRNARSLLMRLAREVRAIASRLRLEAGSVRSAFVGITFRRGVLRAAVSDPTIDARRASIIAAEVRGAVKAVGAEARSIVLDFSACRALSTAGLGLAVEVQRDADERGVRTVLCGVSPESARVLRAVSGGRRAAPVAADEAALQRLLAA